MPSKESQAVWQTLMYRKRTQNRSAMSLEQQRRQLEEMLRVAPLAPDVQHEAIALNGVPAEWVWTPGCRSNQALIYLHGGAYTRGSCESHRLVASHLARASGARVLVIEYRLAPEHPFPAALEDTLTAYRTLLASGLNANQIVISGDSAGGGLAAATLMSLRDQGDPLPKAAVLLSPWTDLVGSGESVTTKAEADPWLTQDSLQLLANMYLGEVDPRHPLVSPVYGDLRGLPPVLVHVGSDEILLDDSTRLVTRLKEAGVDATLKIWGGMWHVFPLWADVVPESKESIREIGDYVKAKFDSNFS